MAVLATIHQPSSEIFYTFDRVIVLSEGQTVYNGTPQKAIKFLKDVGASLPRYFNPADQLLKLAHDPKIIDEKLSVKSVAEKVQREYERPTIPRHLNSSFNDQEASRKSSCCHQFWMIFKRQMTIAYRLPVGMIALVIMAFINSFMLSSVFGGVAGHKIKIPGIDPFDSNDPLFVAVNTRYGKNWMGVINFAATD